MASPNCILGVGGDYSDFQQLQTMVDAEMTAQYVANDGLSLSPKYVNYRQGLGVRRRGSFALLARLVFPVAFCFVGGGSTCPHRTAALRLLSPLAGSTRGLFFVGAPSDS